jgi:nucleoside-diphosphate-sugar epimerase
MPVMRILLVGCGDIARRLLSLLPTRSLRVYALLRDAGQAAQWRAAGALPLLADLDRPHTLHRLRGLADVVVHLAPPANDGGRDRRTRHLLAALSRSAKASAGKGKQGEKSLPQRLIYISTTGVYGDCGGAWIDETRRRQPESPRAGRRVDAEDALRRWGARKGVAVTILRTPGIYAADRLPFERLQRGTPALRSEDDVFTNHIHADDLAHAIRAAIRYGRPNRAINVVDDTDQQMADYFDAVADAFALPRPPRLDRETLRQTLSPVQYSFMRESRRIGNARLKRELHLRLCYPTTADGIAAARASTATQDSPAC